MFLTTNRAEAGVPATLPASLSRLGLLATMALAAGVAFVATSPEAAATAIAEAGPELTRLLRGMAGLKLLLAAPLAAAALWRMARPIGLAWFGAYAVAFAATAAGPAFIWTLVHIRPGALLLHGGLAAALLLLWRDPAFSRRLADAVADRRQRLRARP